MHKQRIFVLIAALTGVIAMFLPWFSYSIIMSGYKTTFGSINGMHRVGNMVFVAFVLSVVLVFTGKWKERLKRSIWYFIMGCGIFNFLVIVWNTIRIIGEGNDTGRTIEIGFYLTGFAALCVVLAVNLFRTPDARSLPVNKKKLK